MNYVNKYDKPVTMMNGKFHKSWGDFGTLRNSAALEYECFRALANGAGCGVGDQLHPCGKLDETVYKHIGAVFEQIEKKEKWCINTKKISQIGVFAANKVMEDAMNPSNEGVYRMLTELHYLFDFIDFEDDIKKYDLLILPDTVILPQTTAQKVSAYLAAGGKLLLTGKSGLSPAGGFAISALGLSYLGDEEYSPAYACLRNAGGVFKDIPPMDYTVYERGVRVDAGTNDVAAYLTQPYFNRTWDHFCSHRQTPPQLEPSSFPFAVEGKNFFYITHPLFKDYAINGCKVHKDIISACIGKLLPAPLVKAELPSTAELTLREKGKSKILHLLHYIPTRRCKSLDTIEDRIPLYKVKIELLASKMPRKIYAVPVEKKIDFKYNGKYVRFTVPEVDGHQMIVIDE